VKILLIDDEQRLLDALAIALQFHWPSAEVLTANSAEVGLSLALQDGTDIIILDVGLRDGSGLDVLARIRESSDVPVILLTGASGEMDRVRGLELGADDYLVKPFGSMGLIAHIKAVLRRAKPLSDANGSGELAVGRLRLHEQRREVVTSGRRIQLTPTEFRLLYHLMRNAGHVVSRYALIRRVWGGDDAATDHDLTVFVARLRAKITPIGEPPAIVAERGVGYRIVAT
jgi:DNA-binding response OmpR family regulator